MEVKDQELQQEETRTVTALLENIIEIVDVEESLEERYKSAVTNRKRMNQMINAGKVFDLFEELFIELTKHDKNMDNDDIDVIRDKKSLTLVLFEHRVTLRHESPVKIVVLKTISYTDIKEQQFDEIGFVLNRYCVNTEIATEIPTISVIPWGEKAERMPGAFPVNRALVCLSRFFYLLFKPSLPGPHPIPSCHPEGTSNKSTESLEGKNKRRSSSGPPGVVRLR